MIGYPHDPARRCRGAAELLRLFEDQDLEPQFRRPQRRHGPCRARSDHHHIEALASRHCSLRSEEHTSELQSLMRTSYAVFCFKKNKNKISTHNTECSAE